MNTLSNAKNKIVDWIGESDNAVHNLTDEQAEKLLNWLAENNINIETDMEKVSTFVVSLEARTNKVESKARDKRELAEKRIDKLGFDEEEKKIVFYDWSEGDSHIEWLLTATEKEINDWFDLKNIQE